jgi:prophage maintenance system killer protein
MPKLILALTRDDFVSILRIAQERHAKAAEPIPEATEYQIDNVASCLLNPFQTAFGQSLYRGIVEKAAVLFYQLNKGHLLSNGNKRMACLTLYCFLLVNEYDLGGDFSPSELALHVANSENQQEAMKVIRRSIRKNIRHIEGEIAEIVQATRILRIRRIKAEKKQEAKRRLSASLD